MKENLLRFTSRLALQAGAVLRQYQNRDFNISKKGPIDLVTEADLEVEKLVVSKILERFPDHSVLAEETGMQQLHLGNSKFVWIVDPLDGTTNFAHRYPFFCISIALEVDGELELGVVYDPMAMDLFSAQKHNGAHLNGKQISVSPETALSESLLSTGFPTDHQNILGNLRLFQDFMLASRAVRRNGSAALDLCYTRPLQTLFDHEAQVGSPLVLVTGKGLRMGRQLAGQLLMNVTAVNKYLAPDSGSYPSQQILRFCGHLGQPRFDHTSCKAPPTHMQQTDKTTKLIGQE